MKDKYLEKLYISAKNIKKCVVWIVFLPVIISLMAGCACSGMNVTFSTILGVPIPDLTPSFHSVDYFLAKTGKDKDMLLVDLDVVRQSKKPVLAPFKINGKRPTIYPDMRLYKYSIKGPNKSYYIGLNDNIPFEQQKNDNWCWAACVQHLLLMKDKKYVSQKKLVEALEKKYGSGHEVKGATIIEMMEQMGLLQLTCEQNGSNLIVASLAAGIPPIVCRRMANGDFHAVIVTGAMYSFVSESCFCQTIVAYYRLDVLDPETGKKAIIKATDLDNGNLLYTLSYYISTGAEI